MKFSSLLLFFTCFCCSSHAQDNVLISVYDTISDVCGYRNTAGEMIIPFGKYTACFSDTIDNYGFVLNAEGKFVAIDRKERVLYEVFPFDNGPDYAIEGTFRIVENDRIGYADAKTGEVIIKPQYDCAWQFENGMAKVSNKCSVEEDGEYSTWISSSWIYINKKGEKVKPPKQGKVKQPKKK